MFSCQEFVADRIWLIEYPIRYYGTRFNARTALIKTEEDQLIVHSPGPLTEEMREFVADLAPVSVILAPGTFHHLYAKEWANYYDQAEVFVCPGLERKIPALKDARIIADGRRYGWSTELEHLATQGSRIVNEVVFFHRSTRTLLVVDLIENFTDRSQYNWVLKFWLKYVFRMWDRPRPAPEYQIGWQDRNQARAMLEEILQWDFDKIVLSHGDLIHSGGKAMARQAWSTLLQPWQ